VQVENRKVHHVPFGDQRTPSQRFTAQTDVLALSQRRKRLAVCCFNSFPKGLNLRECHLFARAITIAGEGSQRVAGHPQTGGRKLLVTAG
jgi:hypothetical protein